MEWRAATSTATVSIISKYHLVDGRFAFCDKCKMASDDHNIVINANNAVMKIKATVTLHRHTTMIALSCCNDFCYDSGHNRLDFYTPTIFANCHIYSCVVCLIFSRCGYILWMTIFISRRAVCSPANEWFSSWKTNKQHFTVLRLLFGIQWEWKNTTRPTERKDCFCVFFFSFDITLASITAKIGGRLSELGPGGYGRSFAFICLVLCLLFAPIHFDLAGHKTLCFADEWTPPSCFCSPIPSRTHRGCSVPFAWRNSAKFRIFADSTKSIYGWKVRLNTSECI